MGRDPEGGFRGRDPGSNVRAISQGLSPNGYALPLSPFPLPSPGGHPAASPAGDPLQIPWGWGRREGTKGGGRMGGEGERWVDSAAWVASIPPSSRAFCKKIIRNKNSFWVWSLTDAP